MKQVINMEKQQYDFAREIHLTFASVGGGLHLGILAFRVSEAILSFKVSDIPSQGNVTDIAALMLQLIIIALSWWRLYWVYLNSLVFFVPFDNAGIFAIDIFAFFSGGVGLFFTGKVETTGLWLLTSGIC